MLPLVQGQLDGFCGLYAITNAARLINRMTQDQAANLFQKIFGMTQARKARPGQILKGLSNGDMGYLLGGVVRKEYRIKASRPFPKAEGVTLEAYWGRLQGFLAGKPNRAVIAVVEGEGWSHWTVVRRVTPKTLVLFDSSQSRRINRKDCTIRKPRKVRPVLIYPTMTHFLSREEAQGHPS